MARAIASGYNGASVNARGDERSPLLNAMRSAIVWAKAGVEVAEAFRKVLLNAGVVQSHLNNTIIFLHEARRSLRCMLEVAKPRRTPLDGTIKVARRAVSGLRRLMTPPPPAPLLPPAFS